MKSLRRLLTSLVLGLALFFGAGAVQPAAAETAPATAVAQAEATDVYVDIIDFYVIYDDGTIEYLGTLVIITIVES